MNRPELYGVAELAKRWGVTKQAVSKATRRMPEPANLSCGRVWTLDQVLEFEQRTGRKPVTSE